LSETFERNVCVCRTTALKGEKWLGNGRKDFVNKF